MKTIVEALQDLYVALGGKKADVSGLNLNPDVIEQIAALVNEGALNELPAVTIADAGDVLTVDNSGKWGKATPSGGLPEVTEADAGDVLTVNASGEWEAAAPSGGLPAVTSEDLGKYLQVVGATAPPYVEVIPSQTVTVSELPVALSPTVSALENNTPVLFTVNGVDYATFSQYSDIAYDADNISYFFIYDATEDIYSFVADSGGNIVPGTYTVSLKTGTLSYVWGIASGSPDEQ